VPAPDRRATERFGRDLGMPHEVAEVVPDQVV